MTATKPKRNYKDSIFRKYLETPPYLAGLHEHLTGIPTTSEDIIITTIKNIMFSSQKNDISFLAGDRFMVLMEQQSTVNENMPLRMLLYVAMLYYKQVKRKALYHEKRISLPVPEFYDLCLGDENMPLKETIRLSEAFPDNLPFTPPLELVVTRINISYNRDIDKCSKLLRYKPIRDYSFFVHKTAELKKSGLSLKESIQQATDFCIEHDIMRQFLLENYEEVFDMYSIQWNERDFGKAREEDGRIEMATSNALEMLRDNMPLEKVVKYSHLPLAKVKELAQKIH